MRYVLDTHALLWHLSRGARLGADAKRILNDPRALLIVPVLVLAEAKHAADRKRLPITFERVLQSILVSPRLTVFPMDLYTIQLSFKPARYSRQHHRRHGPVLPRVLW